MNIAAVPEQIPDEVLDNAQENLDLLEENNLEENNEETVGENIVADEADRPDYSALSLNEIIVMFRQMLERADQMEMYKMADVLKASFYKALKRERIAAGCPVQENTVLETRTGDKQEHNDASADAGDVPADMSGTQSDAQTEAIADEAEEISNDPFAEVERGFKELYAQYKASRAKYIQEQEKQKEMNLECKLAVIEGLKELLEKQEDLAHTFPAFRELQNRWKEIGAVPQARVKDVWDSYQYQVEKFYDYVKINNELRDLDLKKNLEIKTRLCEEAEALKDEPAVVDAFRRLQKLHDEWRETGPVARELREEIWNRFKEATAVVNRKHQAFFDNLKEERKQNFEKKSALCEEAEAIAERTDIQANEWNVLSKKMEELQAKWKTIGFAAKKENQKVYDRFRAACDKFYSAKREYYAEFKNVMQKNLELKEALCEQAEAIMNSEEWKKTTDQLIRLQKEWKKIGPVARKQSDAVWKRFRAACDTFFNRKAAFYEEQDSALEVNLKAKTELIEEIRNYKLQGDKTKDMEMMFSFQDRWREIGFVPFKEKEKIQVAYKEAMDAHFSEIRSDDMEYSMGRFAKRIQDLQNNVKGGARILKNEREKLLQRYRKIETDIQTLENNAGFFAKSKNAESLMAELERKIAQARETLVQIEEKIKMIDRQFQEK